MEIIRGMNNMIERVFNMAAIHFKPIVERANEVAQPVFILAAQALGFTQLNQPAVAYSRYDNPAYRQ